MRDSEVTRNLQDIADLSRTKLGKDWAFDVMMMCFDEQGFRPLQDVSFDGEMVELTVTRLIRRVQDDTVSDGRNE